MLLEWQPTFQMYASAFEMYRSHGSHLQVLQPGRHSVILFGIFLLLVPRGRPPRGWQSAPGPQALRDLTAPNTSRSGGPHTVKQQLFSTINFQILKIFCSRRSSSSFAARPQNSHGGLAKGSTVFCTTSIEVW